MIYPTVIKHNFFLEPKNIINYSKTIEWYKPTIKDNWPGLRSDNLCIINPQLHGKIVSCILEIYFGEKYLDNWKKIDIEKSDIRFHKIKYEDWVNHNRMNTRIHKDEADLAGIIYLNQNVNNENTGTSLYNEDKKPTLKISNNFNTLACYDGKVYHGATSLDKEERLTMVIFLNKITKHKKPEYYK